MVRGEVFTYAGEIISAYRPFVGAKRPLLAALVTLIRGNGRGTHTTKDAVQALFGVALYLLNRAALVKLGAVRAFFAIVMTVTAVVA